jgi:parallel beta-helix repeat protein
MKVRIFLWLVLVSALIWAGCTTDENGGPSGPEYSGTPLSSDDLLTTDWSESPYWVQEDLIIPEGETVVIPPDTELRFGHEYDNEGSKIYYKMIVNGCLKAIGTEDQNIVFTSIEGSVGAGDFGQWRSIIVDDADHRAVNPEDTTILEFCLVQFGASADTNARYPLPDTTIIGEDTTIVDDGVLIQGAIFCWESSPSIRNCTILKNGYHGILSYGSESQPNIINTNIYENDGDGIRCEPEGGRGQPDVWFTNCKENNGRQFGDCPDGMGDLITLNVNRDSCDFQNNIKLEPFFLDFDNQVYDLHACSHLINAGVDTTTIGSIPYTVAANELRGFLQKTDALENGTWFVSCNAFVDEGDSLILRNVDLIFEGFYDLQIRGTLRAENVNFLPADPEDPLNWWAGLVFAETADPTSYVDSCTFLNASTTIKEDPFGGAITIYNISPTITGNTFTNNEYTAVTCLNGAQPEISWNMVDGFGEAAIYCHGNSHPNIHHNVLRNGDGYGIWCNFFSSPTIQFNVICDNSVNGIKCIQLSAPWIEYNSIVGNSYSGIYCYQQSNPTIKNCIIAFNGSTQTWLENFGNGIKVEGSSFPVVTYNDVYQPEGQGSAYGGNITPDVTNISEDPGFLDLEGRDFHVDYDNSTSPCLTAGSDGGEIGAYGQGDWEL